MNYTSRSAVETFQRCNRRRYIEYFWHGKGITPTRKAIPLMTGSAVHEGLSCLHLQWMAKSKLSVEDAAIKARQLLGSLWGEPQSEIDQFHCNQQQALAEAQIHAYVKWLLSRLMRRHLPLAVEKEISFELGTNLTFEARPDLLLLDTKDNSLIVVDYKTLAQYDQRRERQVSSDLQGLTEAVATQEWLNQSRSDFSIALETLGQHVQNVTFREKVLPFLDEQLRALPVNVTGTKMIFILKGKETEEKRRGIRTGRYLVNSPLISGYRQLTPSGYVYSHSWFYPNEANDSGVSALGRSWEKFFVWEQFPGGVKEWIELLDSKVMDHQTGKPMPEIQPECGDILEQQFWLPVMRSRNLDQNDSALLQMQQQEESVFNNFLHIKTVISRASNVQAVFKNQLDVYFPMFRHSCDYPTSCPYKDICYKKETFEGCFENPIPWGYMYRVPNHELERKQFTERYGEESTKGESHAGEGLEILD